MYAAFFCNEKERRKMANANLGAAKRAKNDEFYTQLTDIEKELRYYKKYFKDKTVLCNCDDPFESNFFKYFVLNFNRLKLKKLICTCYEGSAVAEYRDGKAKPYKAIVTTVHDANGDGGITMDDVRDLFDSGKNELTELQGDGDFRSEECLELLEEADIVVTNPPFSLFREYVNVLMEHEKKFVIVGNMNAITYKEIFPLLRDNQVWLGHKSLGQDMFFDVLDEHKQWLLEHKKEGSAYKIIDGIVMGRMAAACWFTNLDLKKRHEDMILVKKYTGHEEEYPKYDNYDAIEVSKVANIPLDYDGAMGVPITFLDKYSPDQFEILGTSDNGIISDKYKTTFGLSKAFVDDYYKAGGKGSYKEGNPTAGIYKNGIATMVYKRLFIRNKHPEKVQINKILGGNYNE